LPEEGPDWVKVTIAKRILKPEVMRLILSVDARFALSQRERIALGILAQADAMTAKELAAGLEVPETDGLKAWIGRLLELGIVDTSGRTSAMKYFVASALLRGAALEGRTTLSRIPPHRLRALIVEDLSRYPGSSTSEIQRRVGAEIGAKSIKRALDALIKDEQVHYVGERRWRRYTLAVDRLRDTPPTLERPQR